MASKSVFDVRGPSQSSSAVKQIEPISKRWQTNSDTQSFIDDRCPTVWQAIRPSEDSGIHPPRHTARVKPIDMSLMDRLYNAVQDEKRRREEEDKTQAKQRSRGSREQTSSSRQQAVVTAAEQYSEIRYERVTRPSRPSGPRSAPTPSHTSTAEAQLTNKAITDVREQSAATASTRTRSSKGFHIKGKNGEEAFIKIEIPAMVEANLLPSWTDPIQMTANVRNPSLQETGDNQKDTGSRNSDRTSKDAKADKPCSTTEPKRGVAAKQSAEVLMSGALPDSPVPRSPSKLQAQSAKQSQLGFTGMFSQMGTQSRSKHPVADKKPTVESVASSRPLDKSAITVKLRHKAPSSRSFEEIDQERYAHGGACQSTQHSGAESRPPSVQGSSGSVLNWGVLADSAIASQKSSEGRSSVNCGSAWHQSIKSKQSGPPEEYPASQVWDREKTKEVCSTIALSPIGNEIREGTYDNESNRHSARNLTRQTGSCQGSHAIAVWDGVKPQSERFRQLESSGDVSAPTSSPVDNVWEVRKRDRSTKSSRRAVRERLDDDFVEVAVGWNEEGGERLTLVPRSSTPSVRGWTEKNATSWKASSQQGSGISSHVVSQNIRKKDDWEAQDVGRMRGAGDSRISSERKSRRQSQALCHTPREDDGWEEQDVGQPWDALESRVASSPRIWASTQSGRSEARAEGFDNASVQSLNTQQDHSEKGSSGAGFSQAPPASLGSCPTKDRWGTISQGSQRRSHDVLSSSRSRVVTVQSDGSEHAHSTSARGSYEHPATVFAGKGWISPHPLSLASTDLESPPASKIELPSIVYAQGATMTYEEWQRIQEDGMRANRSFSITESSRSKTAKLGEIRYRFAGWGEHSSDGYRFEEVYSQGSVTKSCAPSNYRPPTVQSEDSCDQTPSVKPRQMSSSYEQYRPDTQKSRSRRSSYYEKYRPLSERSCRSGHDEQNRPERYERAQRSRQSNRFNPLSSSERDRPQPKSMITSKTASASAASLSEREREWEVMEEGRNVWSVAPQAEIVDSHSIRGDADSRAPTSELYFERYAGSPSTATSQKW